MKIEQNLIGVTDATFESNENTFSGSETIQKHVFFVNETSIAMAKKNFILRFLKRLPQEKLEELVNLQMVDVDLEGQYSEGCRLSAELTIRIKGS